MGDEVHYANSGKTEKYVVRYIDKMVEETIEADLLVADQGIVWLIRKPDKTEEQTVFIGSLEHCSITLDRDQGVPARVSEKKICPQCGITFETPYDDFEECHHCAHLQLREFFIRGKSVKEEEKEPETLAQREFIG